MLEHQIKRPALHDLEAVTKPPVASCRRLSNSTATSTPEIATRTVV